MCSLRKYEDIFAIQDEISAHIVEALTAALGGVEMVRTNDRPTDDLEAYELYLQGRHFWQKRGEEGVQEYIRTRNHTSIDGVTINDIPATDR